MEEKPARKDTSIAIIVIIAGLLSGAVLTYTFLKPEEQPRYTPEYPVAESQRMPLGSAEAATDPTGTDADPQESEQDAGAPETAADASPSDASETSAAGPAEESVPEEASGADRAAIRSAERQIESEGVTEYAELTEDLYIRISAKMVIAAAMLTETMGEDADPAEAQRALAEYAGKVLAEARVDPEEFWAHTRDIHSDPERAKEMGEKILREAEKHTGGISLKNIQGIEPIPVPGTGSQ